MGHLNPNFAGETVFVTGAASGIGRETALHFSAAGATVLVADIDSEPKDGEGPTHERIVADGGTAEYVETDVTDRDQLATLVETAREFGGVDVMINNAGVVVPGPFRETPPEAFDDTFAVNARGVYFGTQVAANDMIDRGVAGCIINTASISASHAQFDQVPYDASKGAVRMIHAGPPWSLRSTASASTPSRLDRSRRSSLRTGATRPGGWRPTTALSSPCHWTGRGRPPTWRRPTYTWPAKKPAT